MGILDRMDPEDRAALADCFEDILHAIRQAEADARLLDRIDLDLKLHPEPHTP